MPFPGRHVYMSVIGDCYNAAERWQFGLRMEESTATNEEIATALADDVENWWLGVSTSGDEFGSLPTHRLTELKVARIEEDGNYPDTIPSYSHFYVPPRVGIAAIVPNITPQSTLCVTLTTDKPRGLASKGRIYTPPSAQCVIGTDGRVSDFNAAQVMGSIRNLIQGINASPTAGQVAIFSRGKGEPQYNADKKRVEYTYPNQGAMNYVTGVRIGRVVDTQRRRRRQLVEGYQVEPLA